jgi:hypothetical protein
MDPINTEFAKLEHEIQLWSFYEDPRPEELDDASAKVLEKACAIIGSLLVPLDSVQDLKKQDLPVRMYAESLRVTLASASLRSQTILLIGLFARHWLQLSTDSWMGVLIPDLLV